MKNKIVYYFQIYCAAVWDIPNLLRSFRCRCINCLFLYVHFLFFLIFLISHTWFSFLFKQFLFFLLLNFHFTSIRKQKIFLNFFFIVQMIKFKIIFIFWFLFLTLLCVFRFSLLLKNIFSFSFSINLAHEKGCFIAATTNYTRNSPDVTNKQINANDKIEK